MNVDKFNNFLSNLGYSLPSNFTYNIDVGDRIRFNDKNKKSNNKNLWLQRVDYNIYVFGNWAGDKDTYIDNIR